jgi:hypothetical protein
MTTPALPEIRFAEQPDDLRAILSNDTNMVIWRRSPSLVVRSAFGALLPRMQGEFRAMVSEQNFTQQLDRYLQSFDTTPLQREIICGEIGLLLSLMLSLSSERSVQMVFNHIDTDHCRLFHADHNHLRLVCTFVGKGTEFLLNEDVNRAGLGTGTNAGHIPGRPIQRLNSYDVAIMKGNLFPGNADRGLVHRSPPITAEDTGRIFLAIDAVANSTAKHSTPANVARKRTETLRIQRLSFPMKLKAWRVREARRPLFCEEVKQRYEQSLRELATRRETE